MLENIGKDNAVDNYRPTPGMPLMWKLYIYRISYAFNLRKSGIASESMYEHLTLAIWAKKLQAVAQVYKATALDTQACVQISRNIHTI